MEFAGNENSPNINRNRRQTDDDAAAAIDAALAAADEYVDAALDAAGLAEGSGSTDEGETNPDPEGSSAAVMSTSSAILGFILARIFA